MARLARRIAGAVDTLSDLGPVQSAHDRSVPRRARSAQRPQAGLGVADSVAGARHRREFRAGVHQPGRVTEACRDSRAVGRGGRRIRLGDLPPAKRHRPGPGAGPEAGLRPAAGSRDLRTPRVRADRGVPAAARAGLRAARAGRRRGRGVARRTGRAARQFGDPVRRRAQRSTGAGDRTQDVRGTANGSGSTKAPGSASTGSPRCGPKSLPGARTTSIIDVHEEPLVPTPPRQPAGAYHPAYTCQPAEAYPPPRHAGPPSPHLTAAGGGRARFAGAQNGRRGPRVRGDATEAGPPPPPPPAAEPPRPVAERQPESRGWITPDRPSQAAVGPGRRHRPRTRRSVSSPNRRDGRTGDPNRRRRPNRSSSPPAAARAATTNAATGLAAARPKDATARQSRRPGNARAQGRSPRDGT